MKKIPDTYGGGDNLAALPETELIRLSQAGDPAAFDRLAEAYSRRIYNIGLRMLGNREDAADMAQETLLKVYRNLPRFRGDSSFSTWVYRIGVNTCRDMLRAAYRRREMSFSDFGEDDQSQQDFEIADYSQMPEQVFLEQEGQRYLTALLNGLTPKYRLVAVLRELSGLSYQEIADIANISVGTVKSRLNRARAAMRNQLLLDAEQYPYLHRLMLQGGQGK